MKKILSFLLVILLTSASKAQVTPLNPVVDSIPMSDGKWLAADIYIPSGMVSGPVILIQTPYNKFSFRYSLPLGIGINLNSSNYIFVISDWRGFWGSAAAMTASPPSRGTDGKSTVDWIAAQPWCNGKVGTWGPSALGKIQFQTAQANPANLVCICPLVAGPQFDYDEYYTNGTLKTEFVEQLDGLGFGLSAFIVPNPVHNASWNFAETSNYYPAAIQVPAFMIGGWYDHNIEMMLPFFNGIRTLSPASVRNEHRLLMGPWCHGGHGATHVGTAVQGQLTYSNAAGWSDSLALMFFDYHMRNIANGWNSTPYIQYYQMGENSWNTASSWPVSGPAPVNFYFHQDNSLDNFIPANGTDELSFNYDPTDPSPTYGGTTLRADLEQGPYDQSDTVESRSDIQIFTTPLLTQNVVLKGSASVHMKISSNRFDTDLMVRLTDVYPDGRSMLVNDGAFRMRFRNGNTAADTAVMTPGAIYDCVIDLPNTAITFLAGHKIRIDVTSSNYPRFNRNMNTGGVMYPGNNMDSVMSPLIAANKIYTNNINTSYISLPLVGYTGVNEIAMENAEVYPNPVSTELTVRTKEIKAVLSVYNMLGEELISESFSGNVTINTSELAQGIYTVQIRSGNKILNRKLVKQ
ncbi:MAG: CocE/NonD family hydrolase [Bacteroidia bacterium]